METDFKVILREGDTEMPINVQHIVNAAKDELLLKSLSLPYDALDVIRYNASKSAKTVSEYISSLILVDLASNMQ